MTVAVAKDSIPAMSSPAEGVDILDARMLGAGIGPCMLSVPPVL